MCELRKNNRFTFKQDPICVLQVGRLSGTSADLLFSPNHHFWIKPFLYHFKINMSKVSHRLKVVHGACSAWGIIKMQGLGQYYNSHSIMMLNKSNWQYLMLQIRLWLLHSDYSYLRILACQKAYLQWNTGLFCTLSWSEQDPALLKVHFVFVGPTGICFAAFYLPQARLCLSFSIFFSISLSVLRIFLYVILQFLLSLMVVEVESCVAQMRTVDVSLWGPWCRKCL